MIVATDLRTRQRRGTIALAGRETRRVLALWTQTILPPVVTAVLFAAVFGGALGAHIRRIDGIGYLRFILPGLLVMTITGQAFSNNSTSLFQAKNEGYIEDVLTSPLRAWQLALSYLVGGVVRGGIAALLVAALVSPFAGGVESPALAVAALFLTALLFGSLGVITGIWADSFDQHAFVANLVVTPLALLGGVFYSARSLSEPWATLTRADPLYYVTDATRAALTGVHEANVSISLVVTAGFAVLAFAAAVALITTGWRLKP